MRYDLSAFSPRYALARRQFQAAATAAGLRLFSLPHPLPGRESEALALDVALAGRTDARKLLIVSSAVHGVEGHCGSGVQVHSLRHCGWYPGAWPAGAGSSAAALDDVAVLYLHAVNPWGFSNGRRVTQENVDLNRNYADFSAAPANPSYRALHEVLLPPHWPPTAQDNAALAGFIASEGMAALQTAVSSGQYEFPDGLFYGGAAPTWSRLALSEVLRTHAAKARDIAWIDLHTGLGPTGHGERIYGDGGDEAAYARAQAWWGGEGRTPVTRHGDDKTISALLSGTMSRCLREDLGHARCVKISLEFGTQPPMQVLQALRAEQWLQLHPQTPEALAAPIRQAMRDAFYVDTPEWKALVLEQALEAMTQAVNGLRETRSIDQ